MKEIIARLVRAREEKNITLQDISYKTNIRLEILARIESGDTSFQPMPYIKAILRKYAETVGIKLHQSDFEDHTQTLTNENTKEEPPIQQPASPEPISVAVPSTPLNFEIPQPEQSHKKRLIYASLAGALIATLCAVWYLVKQTERISQDQVRSVSDQQVITKALDTPAPVQESEPKQIAPKQIAVTASEIQRKPVIEDAQPAAKLEKKHVLVVRSKTDTCWISVASDKNNAKEILLTPSAVATFNADSLFTLTVGKLETTELWLNGKPVTLPRRSGVISGFKLMPPKD